MIPFSPPRIDQKIIDEVVDTLKSGWITTGPKTKKFEKKIQEYCHCGSVVCVSSATAGLELVLRWFGVKEGDEVIVPAYTYCATANVVVHCGATPVMADIHAGDFNINPDEIEKLITPRTKVIIPVDIAGMPCDFDRIHNVLRKPEIAAMFNANNDIQKKLGRILVLSDAAHSFGAWSNGTHTGSLTDISVFSFHAVKNLTTAEGGAIAFNLPSPFDNEELYKYFSIFSLHGQSKDALAKMQKGNWKYDVIEAGYKANMTDIQASIGLVELERYDNDTLIQRKRIFDFYSEKLSPYKWAELPTYKTCNRTTSYHVFLLKIKNIDEDTRDRIIQQIFDKDVSVNVHFRPLPLLSFYKNAGYSMEPYPVSLDNFCRVISLPVFYDLTDEILQTVCQAVIDSVQEVCGY
ncbi:MAG: capsular biosynthesis protein [Bacteroidetes bacterium HGW-Bacteroidetes-21]|nr:MAG: capsular biosynthesis protein [Bacteroidetes bacterium HGW-Bacteroidetes-21]